MGTLSILLIALILVKDVSGAFHSSICNGEDVVFLLDSSSSIWGPDFDTQLEFLKNVTKNYGIGPGDDQTRVAAATFSDDVHLRFHLNDYMQRDALLRAIDGIKPTRGNTNTAAAIDYANDVMFTEESGSRNAKEIAHVIVIITDGNSKDRDKTVEAATKAKARNIKIFAVGVGDKVDFSELRDISTQPSEDYVFHVDNYKSLSELQETLALRTCGGLSTPKATTPRPTTTRSTTTPPTTTRPTTPRPTTTRPTTPRTTTTERMIAIETAKPIAVCNSKPADVYFVLDASNSIYILDFEKQLQFVADIVGRFDIGPTKTRVGVLVFSDKYRVHIRLSDHSDKATLVEDIKKTPYLTGFTNTADAIRYVHEVGFSSSEARRSVGHIAIVITDGISRDPQDTAAQASKAKDEGIYMFAIGVGKFVDKNELEDIASHPPEKFVFQVQSYSLLRSIESVLTAGACEIVSTGLPTGAPTTQVKTFSPEGPSDTACPDSGSMDVMFVVDSRTTPVIHVSRVIQQIILVLEHLNLRTSRIKAGLLSNNCDRAVTSDLLYMVDFASQLQRFMADELLSFDFLLRRLARESFLTENGGRPNTQRKVFLYIDETTLITDDTINLVNSIKENDVKVYVIAVGDAVNSKLVNEIASDPPDTYVIAVRNYEELRHVYVKILNTLCIGAGTTMISSTRGTIKPQ